MALKKQSCLYYIYVNSIETVMSVNHVEATFGDHVLAFVELNLRDATPVKFV